MEDLGLVCNTVPKLYSTQAGRQHQLGHVAARSCQPYEISVRTVAAAAGLVEEMELAQLEHLLEQRSKRLYFQGLRAAGELPARLAAQHPALAPLPDSARRRLLQVGAAPGSRCGAPRRAPGDAA
jgi:hypothetical protein